jgi:hypothetical protein
MMSNKGEEEADMEEFFSGFGVHGAPEPFLLTQGQDFIQSTRLTYAFISINSEK